MFGQKAMIKAMVPKILEEIKKKIAGSKIIISQDRINEFMKEHDVKARMRIVNDNEVEFIFESNEVEEK